MFFSPFEEQNGMMGRRRSEIFSPASWSGLSSEVGVCVFALSSHP